MCEKRLPLTLPSCLIPAQSSQSCHQSLSCESSQRSQGSLEQERKWKQYLEDERIALFLQNEEFMKELQRNRDFLLALERGDLKHFCFCFPCVRVPPSLPFLALGPKVSMALHVVSSFPPVKSMCKMLLSQVLLSSANRV